MIKLNTIRFKISVLYVAFLGAILIAYSAILYFTLNYILYSDFDDELYSKAQEVAEVTKGYMRVLANDDSSFVNALGKAVQLENEGPNPTHISAVEGRWLSDVDKLDLRRDYINVLDNTRRSVAASKHFTPKLLSLFSANLKPILKGDWSTRSVHAEKKYLRVITMPYDFGGGRKCQIQVGASFKPVIHLLHVRLISILVSIPVILLFASFLGRIFALRILEPVVEVTRTAERITHEDLSTRVKTEHSDEEMKYLVNAFNDMISRLQKSFQYIQEFSAHVAHELKTPLAIIHGESEIALKDERTPEEYKRVMQVNLEETDRMIKVIEDMLLLTRLEYESQIFNFVQLDFVGFLRDIGEHAKLLASAKNMIVNVGVSAARVNVSGDSLHLRRLFFNLIDNAIKFTPCGGMINIRLDTQNGKVMVSVSDTGIGIAEEDLPKVFDKFFHRDYPDNATTGTGLGLSVALSIAKAHQGNIEVKSQPDKGSIFTVILPAA